MSVPAYDSYKASGVDWLGEVPTHWSIAQTKREFRRRKVINTGMTCQDRLALTMKGVVPRDLHDLDGLQSSDYEGYQIFEAGDLAFKLIDLQNVKTSRVGMVHSRGIMSPAYIRLEPSTPEVARYGFWYFMALYWTQVFNNLGGGVRQTLGPEELLTVPFPLPPPAEQFAIAAFLDREAGKIDALVEAQARLIELLKEKRQAVISHAVTKGLDLAASMKDAGVEWLGEVPEDWQLTRVKYAASHVVDCLHTTPTYDGELEYPAIRTADVVRGRLLLDGARLVSREIYEERIQRLRPEADDILYTREGERFGLAALVPPGIDLCLGQRMMMIRIEREYDPAYIMWVLNSDPVYQQVLSGVTGATSPHVNISEVINFHVPVPPLGEQRAIAAHILASTAGLDRLASEAEAATRLLQERRAALVWAAVTGKIDVRGLAHEQAEAA